MTRVALVAVGAALLFAAAAWAAPGDPQRVFNAVDQKRAKAIVLTAHDLPAKGWKAKATDFSQANPDCIVKNFSLGALTLNGEAGFVYEVGRGLVVVESDAHIFRTAGEGAKAFAIESKLGLGKCLGTTFAASIHKDNPGLSAKLVRVEPLTLKGLGLQAAGFRILIRLKTKKTTTFTEVNEINLHVGREVSTLGLISTGAPWPPAAVKVLVIRAAKRM